MAGENEEREGGDWVDLVREEGADKISLITR
jgi:hypothetical protein